MSFDGTGSAGLTGIPTSPAPAPGIGGAGNLEPSFYGAGGSVSPDGAGGAVAFVEPPGSAGSGGSIDFEEPPVPSSPPEVTADVKAYVDGELGCYPFAAVATEPFASDPAIGNLPLEPALSRIRGRSEGKWVGTAVAPVGFYPQAWQVALNISSNETYTATGVAAGASTPPFYYGETADCPPQRFALNGLSTTGALGEIDVAFRYETECGLPAWQGVVRTLEVDADAVRLRFDFQRSDGYGPIHYDLRRACE